MWFKTMLAVICSPLDDWMMLTIPVRSILRIKLYNLPFKYVGSSLQLSELSPLIPLPYYANLLIVASSIKYNFIWTTLTFFLIELKQSASLQFSLAINRGDFVFFLQTQFRQVKLRLSQWFLRGYIGRIFRLAKILINYRFNKIIEVRRQFEFEGSNLLEVIFDLGAHQWSWIFRNNFNDLL